MNRFIILAPSLFALALAGSACSSADPEVGTAATEPTTTAAPTTHPPTTEATTTQPPTTEAPTSETTALDLASEETQSSLLDRIADADIEEIEAILATDEGRDAFIESVLEIAPGLTRDQAECFLDNFDLALLVEIQTSGQGVTADQLGEILVVLNTCEIPLTAFSG